MQRRPDCPLQDAQFRPIWRQKDFHVRGQTKYLAVPCLRNSAKNIGPQWHYVAGRHGRNGQLSRVETTESLACRCGQIQRCDLLEHPHWQTYLQETALGVRPNC